MRTGALVDLTDGELREAIRREGASVRYSYNSMVDELQRRTNRRLTLALVVSTVAYTVLTGLLVVVVVVRG